MEKLVSFQCEPDEYNEVASLFFTDSDTAIKQLFHFREDGGKDPMITFSSGALFVFWFPYICMACWTYGIAIPSGLFVPSLLSGDALGRLFGHILHKLDGDSGTFADSGTYALVGAACGLGGMARMTISLTVILLEATGDMQYVLPLMLSLMAARFTGNLFNEGLYDVHIKLKKIPFLEADLSQTVLPSELTAAHVMSVDCLTLAPVACVGDVYSLLHSCEHECFPITDHHQDDILVGTILRKTLCALLYHRAFLEAAEPSSQPAAAGGVAMKQEHGPPQSDADVSGGSPGAASTTTTGAREVDRGPPQALLEDPVPPDQLPVSWFQIAKMYPRYPDISDCELSPEDRQGWLDLRPYINSGPYIIHENTSLQRTYRLFRTMGLRHLCVVDLQNRVVGIITRRDLTEEALEERVNEFHQSFSPHSTYRSESGSWFRGSQTARGGGRASLPRGGGQTSKRGHQTY